MLKTDAKSKMVKNERKRKSENDEIHIDSSCIINRRFLRYTKGYPWNQKVSSQPPRSHSIAYPKVSMYYAFNEDTDPFTRVPISCKSLFNDEDVHFVPPKKPFTERDVYSEAEARNEYLRRKPTCFVVFGKPGLGGCKLSKLIADAWQCVLVSPMTVIQEEINKQSRIGNCMLKILQQGRTISPNIILKLMESRIRKRDAVYKGYIVEGLPLIPNNADLDYSSYPDYNPENELQDDDTSTSTSSTSFFNESGDIKINYSSSVFNINVESLFLDDDNNTSDLFRNTLDAAVQPTIAKQINNIFTEWPVKPTIIIYIMSPDKDVIRKREQTRFNIETGETVNRSISDLKSNSQIFQTQEAAETSFSWMMVENYNLFQDNDSKYLLKRIIDLSRNVESQCAIYEEFAIPVIDQWVLDHKPENVIRVDGRTSVMQMFEIISTRLRILPLTRLILPVKLFKDQSTSNEEEEDMEELVENKFGSKHVDEVFKELKNTDALSLRFPWVLSKWKHFCPVELAKGTLMSGVPKYAVRYMDKLYFLATLENVGLFLENPKTFLLPPNPKVPCRIAIFGPKLSGKTKICNQLADFFDAALIDVCQVEKKYVDECMKLKVNNTLLDITDDVIEELRVRLNNERSDRETRRLRELEEWFKEIKFAFQNFINIQNPTEGEGEDSTNSDHDMRRTYRKLEENDVPFLVTDLALQEQILANPQLLYNYAPKELRNEEEPVRDLTKNDPEVVEILKERVKYLDEQPIELNVEEKANMIAEIIISLPQKQIDENLFRDADFVIDNMYMDADVWTKLVEELDIAFENVIIIFEDSPYKNLLNKYSYLIDVDDEEVESLDNLSTDSDEEESSKYVENIEYITNFNYKRKVLEEKVEASGVSVIACDLSRDEATLENIVNIMSDPLKEKARILTDEEREEMELVEIEAIEISTEREKENDEGEEEVADEGEENENYDTKKMEERDNINLGDTNHYCPIALLKHHVLLKGNKDFSVFYNNKIYLLSNENALNDLIKDPAALGLPLKEPLATIPPLRVSIIGPIGCGKSSLSSNLSKHYGLMNIKYLNNFTKFMDDRQMSSFTYHKSIIFPEELPVTINLPENLDSEMYNIDKATIQTFILQYWKNGGYLPKNMLEECLLKFFKYPYNECGAVFDGFPSCIEDVDTMQKNYTVPEIIIELSCDITEASERIVAALLKSWMKEMEIKKTIEEDRYQEEMENYINKREIWIKEEIKKLSMLNQEEERYETEFENLENLEHQTAVTRDEMEEIWHANHEEPQRFLDWEDIESAQERISLAVNEKFLNDVKQISDVKNSIKDTTIPWVKITTEKNQNKVWLELVKALQSYAQRNISLMERTQKITGEMAERLLDCGYYFLSSFGRFCPVQAFKRNIAINNFLPMEARHEIYPVIHRQYIYFLGGKEATSEFINDPLKYILQDSCLPLIVPRISIIGPPKSGKSTLAKKFASIYGMKVVTAGEGLRNALQNFPWTELARLTEEYLRLGNVALNESVSRAVEMSCIDPRASTQGYILDGFPSTREESEKLAFLGIQPMIVLDLKANSRFCLECLTRDANPTKKPANFSSEFLMHRYEKWRRDEGSFRNWLKKFAQNMVEVDGSRSKWGVWLTADRAVQAKLLSIQTYFREADYDVAHSLEHLCISPYEFRKHQSRYESFCPLCLFHDCSLNFSGAPPNSSGMFQFRGFYYWICPSHREEFLENPSNHLPPTNTSELPKERPKVLEEIVDVHHACWAKRLVANGVCLVTYADNLPRRKIEPGLPSIAVIYRDKLYLFCEEKCLQKFLCTPDKYATIKLHFPQALPKIDVNFLPNIGYLEQTVARMVIRAVNQVSVQRPKLPGLSPSASAAIYLGIYLKINNVSCKLNEISVYEEALKRVKGQKQILQVALRHMKRQINPYIIYDRPRRVPVPDARFDYLCEYFKPASKVPAFLNVVDIAGLVKGAAEGQGLGNAFLSNISACDGIFHLCRAFEDDDVTHVEGDVNPVRDLEIISEELRLKDVEFLNGHLDKLEKLVVRGNDKKLKPEYETLLKVKTVLVDDKRHIRFADWSANDIEVLNKYLFLTSKPVIYLVNLSEKDYIRKKNKWLMKIKEWVDKNDPGSVLIPFSGVFENKIVDMDDAERAKYFEENKVTSALDKIIVQGYKALQLQYFFTAGHDEVKAWTIQKGTKAPQAAGKIHTDFEKGFIMAEVMKYDDFKNEGSEAAVKAAGKYRQQGRNYVVEDGDIIFFKFNAGAGLKDAKKK